MSPRRSLAPLLAGLALAAGPAFAQDAPKEDAEKVRARAFLSTDKLPAGGEAVVAVVIDVRPGWHVYGNPGPNKYAVPTTVSVETKRGTQVGEFAYPTLPPLRKGGERRPMMELTGRVVLRAPVTVPAEAAGGDETLTVKVKFQACDDHRCLRPKTLTFGGMLPVAAPGAAVRPANEKWFEDAEDGAAPASRSAATRTAER